MMAVPSGEMMIRFRETTQHCPDLDPYGFLKVVVPMSRLRPLAMEACFQAEFIPVWGCTEATGVVLANRFHRQSGATGSVIQGYQAK